MKKIKIGTLNDLKKNNQFSRWVNDHDILIYKFNSSINGISNICPHFGGPIGYHEIKYKDNKPVFTCLWHNLQYSVETGKCITKKNLCLRKYKVEVVNEEIFVYIN
jgi:nitrite reductase/ring-hydroxylating ferredoxin subunit|tara:strand:- start:390 stop:707 length:318 start_codon:yes stop_codon:yes gene_type:complete